MCTSLDTKSPVRPLPPTPPSGIHLLPTEILQSIFLFCVRPDHGDEPCREYAPWTLTQICRSWRHIAIGYPTLWNRIYIPIHHPLLSECHDSLLTRKSGTVDVLQLWMERASIPLSITVDFDFPHFDAESWSGKPGQVINSVHSYISRIKEFGIKLKEPSGDEDVEGELDHLCPALLDGATMLEFLEVAHFADILVSVLPTSLPRLRTFDWIGDPSLIHRFNLPWAQITDLRLSGESVGGHGIHFLTILSQTPALTHLQCQFVGSCRLEHCQYEGEKITLQYLSELNLHGNQPGLLLFLQHLRLPSLRDLTVAAKASSIDKVFKDRLLSFLSSEGPGLEVLYLLGMEITNDQLLAICREVSGTLKELDLARQPLLSDDVFLAFIITEEGPALCPHLECLRLYDWYPEGSPGALASLVESRCANQQSFSEVLLELAQDEYVDKAMEDKVRLERLVASGKLHNFAFVCPEMGEQDEGNLCESGETEEIEDRDTREDQEEGVGEEDDG